MSGPKKLRILKASLKDKMSHKPPIIPQIEDEEVETTYAQDAPRDVVDTLMTKHQRKKRSTPRKNFRCSSSESSTSCTDEGIDLSKFPQKPVSRCRPKTPPIGNDNNVTNLGPRLKDLCINSPVRSRIPNVPICVRFYVETSYFANDTNKDLLYIACEPLGSSQVLTNGRDSTSTGYVADTSRAGSLSSGSAPSHIPLRPSHLTRISSISSSSGANSHIPSSASDLVFNSDLNKVYAISPERVAYLKNKWNNSNLLFKILDAIDKSVEPSRNYNGSAKVVQLSRSKSLKRNYDHDDGGLDANESKRLRQSSLLTTKNCNLIGRSIFAKWKNKKYYYGRVTEFFQGVNKLRVLFADDMPYEVHKNLIVEDLTLLIGKKIMVNIDADRYVPGVVTSIKFVPAIKYVVLTDWGDFNVSPEDIYFTEYEAKVMREVKSKVDNKSLLNRPSCSGIQSRPMIQPCSAVKKRSSTSNSDIDDLDNLRDVNKNVMGSDMETSSLLVLHPTLKLKSLKGKVPKRENKKEDSVLGPVNFVGSWFDGYYFLITMYAGLRPIYEQDDKYNIFSQVPFVYDRLVQQIQHAKGRVVEQVDDVPPCSRDKTFLITNRPCITSKYLKCLIKGIKIVSHEWIVKCTLSKSLLPYELLPAGWSIELERFISLNERMTLMPFTNFTIQVARYKEAIFSQFWIDICMSLGANAFEFDGDLNNVDLIVAENGMRLFPEDVPMVSSTWVIQCIIHGEVREFKGHPMYNHMYEELEDADESD